MRNIKYIPTAKLKQILDSHHCTGIDGADYEPVKDELNQILWERLNRENEKIFEDYMNDLNDYEMHHLGKAALCLGQLG